MLHIPIDHLTMIGYNIVNVLQIFLALIALYIDWIDPQHVLENLQIGRNLDLHLIVRYQFTVFQFQITIEASVQQLNAFVLIEFVQRTECERILVQTK